MWASFFSLHGPSPWYAGLHPAVQSRSRHLETSTVQSVVPGTMTLKYRDALPKDRRETPGFWATLYLWVIASWESLLQATGER